MSECVNKRLNCGRRKFGSAAAAALSLLASTTLSVFLPYAGNCADTSFDSGVKQFKQGSYAQALTSFNSVENSGKVDANLYYYEALCYQQLKNYAKARQLFEYIRTKFPTSDAAILATQALGGGRASSSNASQAAVTTAPSAGPEEATVPFTRWPSGAHVYVKVLVNGEEVMMMLDTGAAVTLIPQSVLNNAGIKLKTVKNAMRMTGVGGETSASVGRVMIQFGEISQPVPVCIQDDTIPGAAPEYPLLGQSFLAAFNYEINYRNSTVKISRIRPDKVKGPKKGVRSYSRDPNAVPFSREGNLMIVTPKVNGRECEMIFDTGASTIAFSDKSMAAIGINVPINSRRQLSAGVGGNREGYGFSLEEMQLGSIVRNRVRASMASYSAISKPLLGYSFLEGTDFIVDNEEGVIRFLP